MTDLFVPGLKYASVSITGRRCWLNCAYCNAKYLEGMLSSETPGQLVSLARRLKAGGVEGILISGGFTRDGKLPFKPFLRAIARIKKELGMVVSIHPGLVDEAEASELRRAGVDVVDFEFVADPYVARRLKNLSIGDGNPYTRALKALFERGPDHVVPHLVLGLNHGKITGYEAEAIDVLADFGPELTVILAFNPAPGTLMESSKTVSRGDALRFLRLTRRTLKGEVALGCMRPPHLRGAFEELAIREGLVERVAMPAPRLVQSGIYSVYGACCSTPREHLHRFLADGYF